MEHVKILELTAQRIATQDDQLRVAGLTPLLKEAVEAHKAAELASAPRKTPFARLTRTVLIAAQEISVLMAYGGVVFGIVIAAPTLLAQLIYSAFGLAPFGEPSLWWNALYIIGACSIAGWVATIALDRPIRVRMNTARWVEEDLSLDGIFALPREVQTVARKALVACPASRLVIHELVQDVEILDPVLELRSPSGESSNLAIWKYSTIIALA